MNPVARRLLEQREFHWDKCGLNTGGDTCSCTFPRWLEEALAAERSAGPAVPPVTVQSPRAGGGMGQGVGQGMGLVFGCLIALFVVVVFLALIGSGALSGR